MADNFASHAPGLESPAVYHFAVVPGASDFAIIPRAFWVQADGTVTLKDAAGVSVVYNVVAGDILPLRAVACTAATATVVGWY